MSGSLRRGKWEKSRCTLQFYEISIYRYILHRKLFKDEYFLLRTQMLNRHQNEKQQSEKIHRDEEDELIRALAMDKKKLPKVLRQEAKTRSAMFKESLRIGTQVSFTHFSYKINLFSLTQCLRLK